jgi:hypothetical protein
MKNSGLSKAVPRPISSAGRFFRISPPAPQDSWIVPGPVARVGNSGAANLRELGIAAGELPWVDIVRDRSEKRTGFKFPNRRGNALWLVQELSARATWDRGAHLRGGRTRGNGVQEPGAAFLKHPASQSRRFLAIGEAVRGCCRTMLCELSQRGGIAIGRRSANSAASASSPESDFNRRRTLLDAGAVSGSRQ